MKTFDDLQFEDHPIGEGKKARLNFNNGYGVSVITGSKYFCCDAYTYEVAVLKDDCICYSTPITDDVLGYQTKNQISRIMKEIQSYERDQY